MCLRPTHGRVDTGTGQLYISFGELVVFLASVIAAFLHFNEANIWSMETKFHLTHALFCSCYVIYHFIYYYNESICLCDPFNIFFPIYFGMYGLLIGLFIRFWKKAMRLPSARDELWWLRLSAYFVCWACVSILYIINLIERPCSNERFDVVLPAEYMSALVATIDSALLAYSCYNCIRVQTKIYGWNCKLARQLFLFLSLPVSFALSMILSTMPQFSTHHFDQIFVFLVPSMVTLIIMWDRHYIKLAIAGDLAINEQETLSWVVNRALESEYLPNTYLSVRLIEAANNDDNFEPSLPLTSLFIAADVREELSFVAPLSSEHSFDLDGGAASTEIVTDQWRDGDSKLTIYEDLRSLPEFLFELTRLFVSHVSRPRLEKAFVAHLERTHELLAASKPTVHHTVDIGNLEQQRKFSDLEHRCDSLTAEYQAFVQSLQVLVDALSNVPRHDCGTPVPKLPFKSSRSKKSKSLAHLSTNMHVHSVAFQGAGGSKTMSTVTFGAPAAHALGFSDGGLLQLQSKLESGGRHFSPETGFQKLKLLYVAKARESIVFSQALGAMVTAAVDWLERCFEDKKQAAVHQVANVGLLLHSVCLLSTGCVEEGTHDYYDSIQ